MQTYTCDVNHTTERWGAEPKGQDTWEVLVGHWGPGESTDYPASTTWTYNATLGTTPTGRLVVEIWGSDGAPADMRALARARVAVKRAYRAKRAT